MQIINLSKNYTIVIDAITYRHLQYVTKKYNKEFTSLLHAERDGDTFYIKDAFFPNQLNTDTHTEFESNDMIALMSEGLDITKVNGHFHSHVNMNVEPSPTDESEIIDRAQSSGFNAAIILNKKGEIFGHIADIDGGLYIKDVNITFEFPFTDEGFENHKLSMLKNCKTLMDAEKAMEYTMWEHLNELYPFTDDVKKYLDSEIKSKFSSPVTRYEELPPKSKQDNRKQTLDPWDDWSGMDDGFDYYAEYKKLRAIYD